MPPFPRQRTREIEHRTLGGVVGNGLHADRVAPQRGNRGHVDDGAPAARDHAGLGDGLREQEVATHVEIHHLVPGTRRVLLGRSAPARAGVVHEDVDVAQALQRLARQPVDVCLLGAIGGDPARINAGRLQFCGGLLQLRGLAACQHDARTRLAQRVRHLQAQPARAARDQRRLAGKIKQLLNRACHGAASPEGWLPGHAARMAHCGAAAAPPLSPV